MNLNDFTIINHHISFNNPYYANLENLLNSNFNKPETLKDCLNELIYLEDHWNNIQLRHTFIEARLGGYWDWEGLGARNVTGNWFTLIAFDDLNGYINADDRMFYLENEILINEPIVEMPMEAFIDILQQWKQILLTS